MVDNTIQQKRPKAKGIKFSEKTSFNRIGLSGC